MSARRNENLSQLSDEALVARYRAGVARAFAELVYRYERELYNYLRRYLGDATLAEDVFQNTFLQFHQKLDLYEAGRPVRPWLYTIATNQAIDMLRKVRRHEMLSLDNPATAIDQDGNSFAELLEGPPDDPLANLELAERRQQVREALARLPERLRSVVILAYFQGLKYSEIAEVLDVPVGTVKSRLHAAVTRLAQWWQRTHVVAER